MVQLRPLVYVLAVLLATAPVASAEARTETSAAARPSGKRKPVKRAPARGRRPLARNAVTAARPSALSLSAGPPIRNSAPAGATEDERTLQARLDAILSSSTLKSAINGVYVVDARTGAELYAYAADRQLNPASNTKLVSTATAFDALGPDYTYATRLYGPAPDADGVIHGDVTLLGTGDPTLRVAHLVELVTALRQRGVTRIEGDVIVSSDDRDALALPYVRVTVSGGVSNGERARVRVHPEAGVFVIANRATTGKARKRGRVQVGAVRVVGDGGKLQIAVSGKIRRRQELSFVRGVPRPVLFTGQTLRASLIAGGIHVTGGVEQRTERPEPDESGLVLATHESVPLRQLAAMINKPSNNFLADRLILTVGSEKYGGERSMQKGVRAMSDWLARVAGVAQDSYRLENGSGLSHLIHISPRQIASVLLAGAKDERVGKDWINSLAIGGVDGTLRARFAGHPAAGYVFGKTGTLAGVAALSGFVTISDDHSVCFSILTSGFGSRRKQSIRAGQAQVADAIFEYLKTRAGGELAPPPTLEGDGVSEDADSDETMPGDEVLGNPDVEL